MKFFLLFVLAGGAAGAWFYFSRDWKPAETNPGALTLYGNVDIRDVALSFRVSGRVVEAHFEEGDRVKTGDCAAVLDKQPFQDSVAVYEARLELAEVAKRKAEKPYLRRAALTKIGAISTEERDDAEAALEEAVASVRSAKASLQQAMTNLKDAELFIPSNGTILTRVREPGSVVAAGEPVYTLALDSPVWVRAYVDEPNLGRVFPGQAAKVSTDSGGSYLGNVGFISPQAEFTPKNVESARLRTDLVYRLRIIVANPDLGLRQGMPVTVTIERPADAP